MYTNQSVSAVLGGKALNLLELQSIPDVVVPPFVVLSANLSERECRKEIANFLKNNPVSHVAVRSSATNEDSARASFAGVYETRLGVYASIEIILKAIEDVRQSGSLKKQVVAHYTKERGINNTNSVAVIVQEMISPESSG